MMTVVADQDDTEEQVPPPRKLEELPLHVRQFLATLTKNDVKAFAGAMALFRFLATGGRALKWVLVTGASVFGTAVAAGQGWEWVVTKFFTHTVVP